MKNMPNNKNQQSLALIKDYFLWLKNEWNEKTANGFLSFLFKIKNLKHKEKLNAYFLYVFGIECDLSDEDILFLDGLGNELFSTFSITA